MFLMDGTKLSEDKTTACVWCGMPVSLNLIIKRETRKDANPDACRDCRDLLTRSGEIRKQYKWLHPTLGWIYCSLWLDELDELWRPIDEQGNLFRPGERLCGLKDCIRPDHVIDAKVSDKIKSEASPPIRLTSHNR